MSRSPEFRSILAGARSGIVSLRGGERVAQRHQADQRARDARLVVMVGLPLRTGDWPTDLA